MLAVGLGLSARTTGNQTVPPPTGFGWDFARFPLTIEKSAGRYGAAVDPRSLVDPLIWTGPAIHVDGVEGNDGDSGLGAQDGDFSQAKRTIHAAFTAGNALELPYRVIVRAGTYEEGAFTRNGGREPDQPVAVLGWQGDVHYRTGPFQVEWRDDGSTASAGVSAVRRVLRTDQLTGQGLYADMSKVESVQACADQPGSWCFVDGRVHVNIGETPGLEQIALIRSFHGARFLKHTKDLYLENIRCEGGITGALHCDAVADRNVVAVNCQFRYSAPSNINNPRHAVQLRRTNGLAAFFNCDASAGAEDGWSFHEDGHPGLHVLTQNCTGFGNGAYTADSCNGFTTHDSVTAIDLGGQYGWSRNGTEVHCIQTTQTWLLGTTATARDIDGTSTAFKCSNPSYMWMQDTVADAAEGAVNVAIEANGGTVFLRDHQTLAGEVRNSIGGSISPF